MARSRIKRCKGGSFTRSRTAYLPCTLCGKVNVYFNWIAGRVRVNVRPSLAHAWNAHEIALCGRGSADRAKGLNMSIQNLNIRSLKVAGMWLFLAPLIIVLGTLDVVTNGRSRDWPLGE